jgi:hypothetical protein
LCLADLVALFVAVLLLYVPRRKPAGWAFVLAGFISQHAETAAALRAALAC